MTNIDANIFKNSATDAIKVTPKEWSNEIEQYARELNYFRRLSPSIVTYDKVGQAGNSLTITRNQALSTGALTDGVATPIQALAYNQVEITAQEHGGAVQITKKQLRDQLPTLRADVISTLGEALAAEEEDVIIAELVTSTNIEKVDATLTAASQIDLTTFNAAITAMKTNKRKPYFFIVHTKVEGDLRILSDFRDASITGSSYTKETGFIGTYFGVNVFSTTNITTETVDTQTAYNNLLLGPRALAFMDKNPASLDIDMGLAIDRSVTFHVAKDYGVQLLNEESVIRVQSV